MLCLCRTEDGGVFMFLLVPQCGCSGLATRKSQCNLSVVKKYMYGVPDKVILHPSTPMPSFPWPPLIHEIFSHHAPSGHKRDSLTQVELGEERFYQIGDISPPGSFTFFIHPVLACLRISPDLSALWVH